MITKLLPQLTSSRLCFVTPQIFCRCISTYFKPQQFSDFTAKSNHGFKSYKEELKKLRTEIEDHFTPAVWHLQHGDYMYQWQLNSKSAIEEWVVSTDADDNSGYSSAEMSLSGSKCLLFTGNLNPKPPLDGENKYAGYCNVRSPLQLKSFGRLKPYNWSEFTHLIIRCRGDGRPYQLNIHMENYFDVSWLDTYTFWLYTRGGPYWQVAKIPFSKFLLANHGRVQDKQDPVALDRVRHFSVTLADDVAGRFSLEIDYIGLCYDVYDTAPFFYEMYDSDPLMS